MELYFRALCQFCINQKSRGVNNILPPSAFGIKNKSYFESNSLNFLPADQAGTVLAAIFNVAPV